jgi:hypothetical protein
MPFKWQTLAHSGPSCLLHFGIEGRPERQKSCRANAAAAGSGKGTPTVAVFVSSPKTSLCRRRPARWLAGGEPRLPRDAGSVPGASRYARVRSREYDAHHNLHRDCCFRGNFERSFDELVRRNSLRFFVSPLTFRLRFPAPPPHTPGFLPRFVHMGFHVPRMCRDLARLAPSHSVDVVPRAPRMPLVSRGRFGPPPAKRPAGDPYLACC